MPPAPTATQIFARSGETEFFNGVAAMSASGHYGPTQLCAGIVGDANLTLCDRVKRVFEAHIVAGCGCFRGIRNLASLYPDPRARGTAARVYRLKI